MTLSRRRSLLAGYGALCAAGYATARAAPTLRCDDLTTPPQLSLTPEQQERHTILLGLAMALVYDHWGVDHSRPDLVAAYAAAAPGRDFNGYAGHNIGAVLADPDGRIVCAALNRNVASNSSMAHAELRTVHHAIDLANRQSQKRWSFGDLLAGHTLYTTLEPCAQCSGVMVLANLASVVYGQDDPAQHAISTLLYNLDRTSPGAEVVLPVRALFAPSWPALRDRFAMFETGAAPGARAGATSFLQSVAAFAIFRDAAAGFDRAVPVFGANRAVLASARDCRARWSTAMRTDGIAPA